MKSEDRSEIAAAVPLPGDAVTQPELDESAEPDDSKHELNLLERLDRRQNHVLTELDALNLRVEQMMAAMQADRADAA